MRVGALRMMQHGVPWLRLCSLKVPNLMQFVFLCYTRLNHLNQIDRDTRSDSSRTASFALFFHALQSARLGAALLGRNLPGDGQIGWLLLTSRRTVLQIVEIWNWSLLFIDAMDVACRMLSSVQFRVPRTRRRRQGPASQSLSEHKSKEYQRICFFLRMTYHEQFSNDVDT